MNKFREPFQAELYVERAGLTDDFVRWIGEKDRPFRLRSLVGAAGSGKSWLMANLFLRLRDQKGVIPLWLDLSEQPFHPDGEPGINVRDETGALHWLWDIIEHRGLPKGKIPFDRTASFAANFAHFATRICSLLDKAEVVLLVDSFDEVSHKESIFWEEYIFSRILATHCVRLIIARRDADALMHPILHWNDYIRRLPGLAFDERKKQIERRHEYHAAAGEGLALPVAATQTFLEPFLGENPSVNAFLFGKFKERQGKKLTSDDLKGCVRDISRRAGLLDDSFDLLERLILRLPRIWTVMDLSNESGMQIHDLALAPLFQSGVVSHVRGTAEYEIDAGIYQLIKQSLQMQQNQR